MLLWIQEWGVRILFSKPEVDYMKSQRLARIATVNKKGQPDVVPVGFEFDGTYFWVGSHDQNIFHRTIKDHNGLFGKGKYLRITPKIFWSMGIEGLDLKENE